MKIITTILITMLSFSCFSQEVSNTLIQTEVNIVRDELNKAGNSYLAALAGFGAATFFHYANENDENVNFRMARNGLYVFSGAMAFVGTMHIKLAGRTDIQREKKRKKKSKRN